MTQTTTLTRLAQHVRITSQYGAASLPYDQQEAWQRQARAYRVTLRYHGRRYTLDFWMGPAHTKEPTAEDVLECLLSDADLGTAHAFEDFCAELGLDLDSRKAERQWKACQNVARHLHRLLGKDYERFMEADK